MALFNGNFRGVIDGKTLHSYSNLFDYDLKTMRERVELVKYIFNLTSVNKLEFTDEEFWQEVWDMGVCNYNLNTTDQLWSDTNISKFIERCADYLLSVDKQEKNVQKVKIYKDKDLFKRMLEEQNMMTKTADVNQSEMLVFVNPNKNYKLAKDIVVTKEDIEKHPEIKAYSELKKYMLELHMKPNKRNKLAKKKNMSSKSLSSMLAKNRKLLEDDMLMIKMSKDMPIIWKSPLKDSGNEVDWEYLDMFDPEHVKALLQVKKDIDICSEVAMDIYDLIEKTELTDTQNDILSLWRDDKTQQDIAEYLNMSRINVKKQLDKIVNKIINTFEKEYEDKYYYLQVAKGKYKKCSKCGEILLIQRFDKNGKKGYRSNCKSCK